MQRFSSEDQRSIPMRRQTYLRQPTTQQQFVKPASNKRNETLYLADQTRLDDARRYLSSERGGVADKLALLGIAGRRAFA
jgi:hypothetical protein